MELYFGGAYNGKLRYIKENLKLRDEDIFYCSEDEIDFSKKVICGLHQFIYYKSLKGEDVVKYFSENLYNLKNTIIICDDTSSGIVPLKREDRKWREETGKILQLLATESKKVVRIFCGIPTVLKDEK